MFLVILTLLVNSNWQNRQRRKSRKDRYHSLSQYLVCHEFPWEGRGAPHLVFHMLRLMGPWEHACPHGCSSHDLQWGQRQGVWSITRHTHPVACQDPACNRPTLTGLEVRFQRHGADLQKASCATLRWPAPSRQRFLTPLPPARSSYLPIQCAWHALAMQASWQIAA